MPVGICKSWTLLLVLLIDCPPGPLPILAVRWWSNTLQWEPASNEGLCKVQFPQLWYHTICMGAFELRVVKFSIRIRERYRRR